MRTLEISAGKNFMRLKKGLKKEIKQWRLNQKIYDWTLIADVIGIEVLKCALMKEESEWRNIVMSIKGQNILVKWECNRR